LDFSIPIPIFAEAVSNSFMQVIFILIGVSLAVAAGFLIAFVWAVKSGQYEDDYTPSVRILFEDETPKEESKETETKSPNNSKPKK
jgi:cbb3-type cytochrome oxidase maturation protein